MPKTNLVPIKIVFGMKADGSGADYPDMNGVSPAIRKGLGWSKYIDVFGIGTHYDKISNLGTGGDTGTLGTCVPKDFADAAIALFPGKISMMTEAQWQTFYDERAHVNESDDLLDVTTLQALAAKVTLGLTLTPDDNKALDRESKRSGIVKNVKKKWTDFKGDRGITIRKPGA